MKYVRWGAGILLLIFLAIQLIPYGRKHTNPAITASPRWNNPQTQSIFARSCADCHSNETVWPWYSSVAPVSWFIQREVDEGRAVFNVSVPNIGEEAEEAAETVSEGEMPPRPYLLLHPSATLSGDEQRAFLIGLMATFGNEGEENERGQAIPSLVREPHDP
jgi:mono/diheme cytochrome c family protein